MDDKSDDVQFDNIKNSLNDVRVGKLPVVVPERSGYSYCLRREYGEVSTVAGCLE